jgi:hypothetical protein
VSDVPLDPGDRRDLRILLFVFGGFVAGFVLLLFLIATDV